MAALDQQFLVVQLHALFAPEDLVQTFFLL